MAFFDWLFGRAEQKKLAPRAPSLRPEPAPPVVAAPAKPAAPAYGIESAIALMRALPMDEDPELVLRVVRKTLRSTGVSVEEIVASAQTRESTLAASVASDRATIERLEGEIAALKQNIEGSTATLEETRSVRERLQDAIMGESKVGLLLPADEMARLQLEAAARRPVSAGQVTPTVAAPPDVKSEEPSGPRPQGPSLPKPSAPPLPSKPSAPPPLNKVSIAPKKAQTAKADIADADMVDAHGETTKLNLPQARAATVDLANSESRTSETMTSETTRAVPAAPSSAPATPRPTLPDVSSDVGVDAPPDRED